ncbi:MAG: polyphosphate polymerase domain-containing protein [Lachnospiraceae bacterium]|nr:polyphosphate polymerase domain-containing protein [Lachnospiraceae bacterium]
MENEKKYRNELKYICTEAELTILESRLKVLCKRDPHVGPSGTYDIRSIYFDDIKDTCFQDNESGTDPRAKYRIRIYNGDDSRITLEKKSKSHGMTHKSSVKLSKEQFQAIMAGNPKDIFNTSKNEQSNLLNEFEALMYSVGLAPKTIVAYKRTPFVYNVGNVRITFDRNIGHTEEMSTFFDKDLPLEPVMVTGCHVLEVKYDELLPNFIYEALNLQNLTQTNFSKYYLSRKRM